MKVIFLGTPEIALDVLKKIDKEHEIKAVITQPDKCIGRSKKKIPSPIALLAGQLGLDTYKPEKITPSFTRQLSQYQADIFVVFAYGLILKEDFLSLTPSGGINIHPSLLPQLRGPSPIQTAILSGMTQSGITFQTVDRKMDCGDLLKQEKFTIKASDNALTIEEKVRTRAAALINPVLKQISRGTIQKIPQNDSQATYCRLFEKKDGLINWNQNGRQIINQIRAFTRWPVAYSFLDDKKINIYQAELNQGLDEKAYHAFKPGTIVEADKKNGFVIKSADLLINLKQIQIQGKKILSDSQFMNGYRDLNQKILLGGVENE